MLRLSSIGRSCRASKVQPVREGKPNWLYYLYPTIMQQSPDDKVDVDGNLASVFSDWSHPLLPTLSGAAVFSQSLPPDALDTSG
jgi:hypothetical protein